MRQVQPVPCPAGAGGGVWLAVGSGLLIAFVVVAVAFVVAVGAALGAPQAPDLVRVFLVEVVVAARFGTATLSASGTWWGCYPALTVRSSIRLKCR
jgi:hypothetical protein